MKNLQFTLLLSVFVSLSSFGQNINWLNLKQEQKHLAKLYTGWDYGVVYGATYQYHLNSQKPILLGVSYSFPSGKRVLDDFKTKIGGEIAIFSFKDFRIYGSAQAIYRRYQNSLVRMQNFGSQFGLGIGLYRNKWFAASEISFDKAIVTNFKHSDLFEEIFFSDVKNGWYQPATGGNMSYGIEIGYSLPRVDFGLSIGKTITQSLKTNPLIPYYLKLGFTKKF